MAPNPPSPPDDELSRADLDALQASARRRLRLLMSGFSTQDIEDAVQDVSMRMVLFVRRNGLPNSREGLLLHMVRAVAANAIRRRQLERGSSQTVSVPDVIVCGPYGEEDDAIYEEYIRIAFLVREYFRLKRASCLPLTDVKSRGESLKDYAARERLSYDQVRQAWSRCVKLIHEAVRKRRLLLGWDPPDPREPEHD